MGTVARTEIKEDPHELLDEIPIQNTGCDDSSTVQVPDIHSVEAVLTFLYCVHCGRRVLQPSSSSILRCDKCYFTMRTQSCERKICTKVVLQVEGSGMLRLTMFQETLKELIPDISVLSEMDIAERLLCFKNVKVKYNKQD